MSDDTLRAENAALKHKIAMLKEELQVAQANNRQRNLELDALHYVWCDGGCAGGVHRWQEEPPTREIVEAAVRNTNRLVQWYRNSEFRLLDVKDRMDYHKFLKTQREKEQGDE